MVGNALLYVPLTYKYLSLHQKKSENVVAFLHVTLKQKKLTQLSGHHFSLLPREFFLMLKSLAC